MVSSPENANKTAINETKPFENGSTTNGITSQQQFEMSKSDEDSLFKLMTECDFASTNADQFVERLQTELLALDTSNIESIINSEENTLKLIDMLDHAVDEIEKLDKRLKEYEDKISAVGDAVRIVGERDNVIQLQQNNQHALLELLDSMMSSLEFSSADKQLLNECDLSSIQKVERCVIAANLLMDILETDLPTGLKKMKAYEDQKKFLEHLKIKFCNSAYNHLKNAIGHSTNKHLESYKIVDNSLNALPAHKQIHDELNVFKELMPWIHRSKCSFTDHEQRKAYFSDIKQNYVETVKQLYLRELIPFCNCAKATIAKHERPKTTASMENLKGSLIRSLDKSHASDVFSIRVDQQTKETLKMVFIKLLNQLSAAVQNEQTFCQEFFNIKVSRIDESMVSNSSSVNNQPPQLSRELSNVSQSSNGTKQTAVESKNDL